MTVGRKKKLWNTPWNYPESFLVVFALLIAGYALQISFGNINFHLYRWPVNGFLGGLLLFIILALGILFQKNHIVRWFSGVHFAVSLMSALLVHTIIMGLTPQISSLSVHVSLVSNLGTK